MKVLLEARFNIDQITIKLNKGETYPVDMTNSTVTIDGLDRQCTYAFLNTVFPSHIDYEWPEPEEIKFEPKESFSDMVQRLKSQDYEAIAARMTANPEMIDLQHAIQGMQTEPAEFTDMIKRHIFYGTDLDFTNGKEEIGDILFYAHLAAKAMGFTIQECEDAVQAKLEKRYPRGFNNEDAVNRNLEVERIVLEGSDSDSDLDLTITDDELPEDGRMLPKMFKGEEHWVHEHISHSHSTEMFYAFNEAGLVHCQGSDFYEVKNCLINYTVNLDEPKKSDQGIVPTARG